MPYFKENEIVPFRDKRNTVLLMGKCIGSGKQADVYKARDILGCRDLAAKHCYGHYAIQKDLFYRKIRVLAEEPSPHPDLCWPISVSPLTDSKSFLYTMPLAEGYHSLTAVINRKVDLTEGQKVELLRKIAEIFRELHDRGFVYGDISAENILYKLNPDGSVSVKVIDCENITLPDLPFGLQGSGKYRAPELLLPGPDGKSQAPTIYSDAYAFQVLAFRILLRRHPLDGELARSVPADDHNGFLEYYARHPRFIFDGDSNPPSPRVKHNWAKLPEPLRLYFEDCFCQKSLHYPQRRTGMHEFLRFLSMCYPM